jgi:hypothetical protein
MTVCKGAFMKQSDLGKKMIRTICVLSLLFMAASAAYYRSPACLPFVLGTLLGALASSVKVAALDRAVDRALEMESKSAGRYVRVQHLLRLFLTGAVLVAAALVPAISLWGAVAGIFAFQIAVYIVNFSTKK